MRHRKRIPSTEILRRRGTETASKTPGGNDLASYLSYAVLILYVLASISATKDEMLLIPTKGIQLPLATVTVSVTGFYFLSPLMVLIGHLVTLRRIPQTFATLFETTPVTRHERLNRNSDLLMLICLLLAGPVTLLLITYRFAAYQSQALFVMQAASLLYSCYAAGVRYQEVMSIRRKQVSRLGLMIGCSVGACLGGWLLLCADVILMPARYSTMVWLKTHTGLLTDEDGGTIAWVPHIAIDRATPIWTGLGISNNDLATYAGKTDSKDWFMTRGIALDVRGRHLRFLDISQQIIPRIWAHYADMSGANLSYSSLYGSVFVGTRLNGASFNLTHLDGSSFMFSELDNTEFNHTSLRGTHWDTMELNQTSFVSSDLSLASMYGVKLNNVNFVGGDFTATSFFETKMDNVGIAFIKPYNILVAEKSKDILSGADGAMVVAPKPALNAIAKKICTATSDLGWEYAWRNFIQLKTLTSDSEPTVISALKEMLNLKQCEKIPDQGLRQGAEPGHHEEAPAPGSKDALLVP